MSSHRVRTGSPYALAAVCVVATLLRLAYLAVADRSFADEHWVLSSAVLDSGTLTMNGSPTTDYEPTYPLFLAGTRLLVGDRMVRVQMVQIAVSVLGCVLLYRLARVATGNTRVAIVAAALFAVYPLMVHEAVVLSETSLFTTLLIGFAASFVAAAAPREVAISGVWLGFAILTRTVALPLIPIGALLLAARGRYRACFTILCVSGVIVAPLLVRNHRINGSWLPTRSGLNLFVGNHPHAAMLLPGHDVDVLSGYAVDVLTHAGAVAEDGEVNERLANRVLTREALMSMARAPIQTAAAKLRNIAYFFWPVPVPFYTVAEDTRVVTDASGGIRVINADRRPMSEILGYTVSYSVVLVLAIAGVHLRRRLLRQDAILWGILASFAVLYALYFPATRYRAPVEFVLLFFAAIGLEALASRWRMTRTPLDP